tara:strand:+ start:1595 stop:1963 length:369 start_codon:yes stop_codon:yes gene_type:complete
MTNWIQTKAGLQCAETITRQLPRITICLEELAKQKGTLHTVNTAIKDLSDMTKALSRQANLINDDLETLINKESINTQKCINLHHRIEKLETMPLYKDKKYISISDVNKEISEEMKNESSKS